MADATTTTMNDAQTAAAEAGRSVMDPVVGTARGVWWVGLGLVTVAGEQTARLVRALAEKGRETQPTITHGVSSAVGGVGTGVKSLASKVGRTGTTATGNIDERIESAMHRMGIVTRSDLQALETKIDELKRELGSHERSGAHADKQKKGGKND